MRNSQFNNRLCQFPYLPCLFLAVLSLIITACDRGEHKESVEDRRAIEERELQATVEDQEAAKTPGTSETFKNYRETGDLPAIEKRGIIRFVHLYEDPGGKLPRSAIVSQSNVKLAERLAKKLGLAPQFLVAESPQQGIDMVINGEADVIADNFAASEERRQILGLTEPLEQTERVLVTGEVLVTGNKGPDISNAEELRNVELTVLADSLIAEAVHQFAADNPSANISVTELPMIDLYSAFVDSIDGRHPLITVMARSTAEAMRRHHPNLVIGDSIGGPVALVWAVRKDADELRTRINNFMTRTLIKAPLQREADWKSIKESGVLRFATYNGPGYVLWKGVLTGLDYELASKFAEENELELQIIVVPTKDSLIDYLKAGKADIAGASTTITESRREQGVEFSTPILETSVRVLSNEKTPPINTAQDLNGRTLTLRAGSAFIDTAQKLRQRGIDVTIEVAPDDVTFGDIVIGVANGEFDATLEDTNLAELQAALYPQLVVGAVASDPLPQGWMVAQGHNNLLDKINQFLESFLGDEKNRAMVNNYFKPNEQLLKKAEARLLPGGKLSPYDKLAKKYALEHNLDWRLVVAQMWQESNFDPKAESYVGAQGLLQVMPQTAQEMGFTGPLFDPDDSVHAGTKYLNWVKDRFEDELPADEKLWFSLAAYNAGIGHLRDARALAKKLGLDPNKWFDNVEVAMLKLSEPRYYEKARYGYARGAEPVLYVKNISNLYRAYTDMVSGDVAQGYRLFLGPADRANGLPGQFVEASPGRPFGIKASGQSCQYARWTPSAGAHRQHFPAERWRLFAGESCPQQSAARPLTPAHGLWPPSPLPAAVSGSSR